MKTLPRHNLVALVSGSTQDPTKTITLRNNFSAEMAGRFIRIRAAVRKKIVNDNFLEPIEKGTDEFAIGRPGGVIPITLAKDGNWEYRWADSKVGEFNSWLKEMVDENILEVSRTATVGLKGITGGEPWTDVYIRSAYQSGLAKGRAELIASGAKIPSFDISGDVLSAAFYQPFHADRVGLMYTRVFNDLKGVTEVMSTQMSRALALGMANGDGPYTIARKLTDRVDKIGITRGRLIARTEVVHTHNLAKLNEFERLETEIEEEILAQWITAEDERVRDRHRTRDRQVYPLSKARTMLGEPNCRCTIIPWIKSVEEPEEVPAPKLKKKAVVSETATSKPDITDLAALRKSYDEAQATYLANPLGKRKYTTEIGKARYEARLDLLRATVAAGDTEGVNKLREEMLISIGKFRAKNGVVPTSQLKHFEALKKGTRYIPLDVMNSLDCCGTTIKWQKQAIRASYNESIINLSIFDTPRTIAHEFGHAIDGMFGTFPKGYPLGHQRFHQTSGSLGYRWKDGVFVTKKTGRDLQKGYAKKHSGTIGTYANGDGEFFEDNWMSNYEGRIYTHGKKQVYGLEWISMNAQRYNDALGVRLDRMIERGTEALADPSTSPVLRTKWRMRIESANKKLVEWETAKRAYPELAGFIEKNFGKDFMIDVPEVKKTKSISKTVISEKTSQKPMAAIGNKAACIWGGGFVSNLFKTLAPPAACSDYVRKESTWIHNGKEVSVKEKARLDAMRIPPAWTNVVVAKDPGAKIQAIGLDVAGRWQYRYSAEHVSESAQQKFQRVKLFSRSVPVLERTIADGVAAGDSVSIALRIEEKTAMRIGSDKDFKAKKKAYGLTTLLNKHVSVDGSKVTMSFTAKKGIPATYVVNDQDVADFIKERLRNTDPNAQLFSDVSALKVNKLIRKITGSSFSVKDYRTYHATRLAKDLLEKVPAEAIATKAQKKAVVDDVLEKVSTFLHNTPSMAKNSYIDPMVWEIIGGI